MKHKYKMRDISFLRNTETPFHGSIFYYKILDSIFEVNTFKKCGLASVFSTRWNVLMLFEKRHLYNKMLLQRFDY